MGFSRHYFKEHNFMLTKISGDIEDKNLMQHVIILNKETKGISNLKELADCREITSLKLASAQMTAMSARNEQTKPGSKLAILVQNDQSVVYGMANAYRMFAEDHRESVKLFGELQEALRWLSDSDLEEDSLNALVNSV